MTLPAGWTTTTVGKVISRIEAGKSEKTLERQPSGDDVGVVKVSAVTWGEFDPDESKAVAVDRFDPTKSIRKGDLLFSRANTVELVGAVVHVRQDHPRLMLSDKILRLVVDDAVESRYLMFALRTTRARRHLEEKATGTSTSMRNVTQETLRETPLLLPPINEQRRVVAKLDSIFVQTRGAKTRLERLPALLDKLKRSILAAAFRGELTADWRAAHSDVEPASTLLDRIRAVCRGGWEAALRAKGKDPTKAKYEPPTADLQTVPQAELPPTWARISVADVAECLDARRVPISRGDRDKRPGPYPYYGANGQVGDIDDYIFDDELVLVTEDETFYGRIKPIAYRVSGKCWVNNHAHVLRPLGGVGADLICYALMHYPVEPWLSGTTGRAKLTQFDLMRLPIGMPPLEEAREIEDRLNSALGAIAALRVASQHSIARFDSVERTALAKAFRGELVEQDPADEPAAVLLDRIRADAEHAAETSVAKPTRGVTKSISSDRRSIGT